MDELTARKRARARFFATAIGVVVLGVTGYLGYIAFVGSDRDASAGAMVLAAGTGFAAFFSPCSFPLLLTFLTGRSTESRGAAVLGAVRMGGGAATLLGVFGVVVAAGGSALARFLEFDSPQGRSFRLTVGLVLIVLGLRQSDIRRIRMKWFDRVAGATGRLIDPSRVRSRARRDYVYGFGYLLTGFG